MKSIKGSLILLITAFIWGSAFVAQGAGADYVGSFTFNASRSLVAALFLSVVVFILNLKHKKKTPWPLKEGMICGIILCAAMGFQQAGIDIYPDGVAASGRAGFLTATYVIMVALVVFFAGKKPHFLVFVSAIICLAGMYFLCLSNGLSQIYLGDILELICACIFTAHIIVVDKFNDVDSVKLSLIQFAMCFIISSAIMLFVESPSIDSINAAGIPILYAGVMSSGVAYTLQIVGQKYAPPAVASIIMSLESVFAALTGWLILNEYLSAREILGCLLVFIAVIVAQLPEMLKH